VSEQSPERRADVEIPAEALVRADAAGGDLEAEEESPRGTLVLVLLFLAAMAGVWLYVYFLLIERVQ
jgi:hypothetical protein